MKIEDIIFWAIIIGIIGLAIWMLHGSPSEASAIISLATAVGASELILWRKLFDIDKKTAIGFIKTRSDINDLRKDITNNLLNIENKLDNSIKRIK